MTRRSFLPLVAALLLLPACAGYVLRGTVAEGESLAVPLPRNDSEWIGIETDLAVALRRDVQRLLGASLASGGDGDWTLETTLVDPERRGRVGLRRGAFALGSSVVAVDWRLLDASGREVDSGRVRREFEFVTALDQTAEMAYGELFQDVSEAILLDVAEALAARAAANPETAKAAKAATETTGDADPDPTSPEDR